MDTMPMPTDTMTTLSLWLILIILPIVIAAVFAVACFLCRNIAAGVLFAAAVTVLVVALGGWGKLPIYWDTPSACLVLITVAILVGGQGKWSYFWRGLRSSFSSLLPDPSPENAGIAALFRYVSAGTFFGGGFWTLTGLVLVLADLKPDRIGAGLAVCLLPLFYAFFLSVFVFNPIAWRFEQRFEQRIEPQK